MHVEKNTMYISSLEMPRYYGVTTINVPEGNYRSVVVGSHVPEFTMPTPYQQLVDKLKKHFALDDNPTSSAVQQYRNYLSALNGYLAFNGKTLEANIGVELLSQFDNKLDVYLKSIQVAPRTLKDRARQLRAIRALHLQGVANRPLHNKTKCPLAETLRRYVAESGIAPKTLAKQSGVDPTTLSRWLAGATPRDDTLPALRRLEVRLGIARDELVQLITKKVTVPLNIAQIVPAFRARIAERPPHGLKLAESELGEVFVKEWRSLFDYKVCSFPTLKRQERGTWRLIPKAMSASVSDLARKGDKVCPTADLALSQMRAFLGVVTRLPPEAGGLAWAEPPLTSLALCAHPRALECYLEWLSEQAEGIRHGGHKTLAAHVACLVRPETGFLWQQAAVFRERLPAEIRPSSAEEWKSMCDTSHRFLRNYIQSASGKSRHPDEPIANLLALQDPFQPIIAAIDSIQEEAASCAPGGWLQAVRKRDALLLGLLLSNPLRVRTLMSLTWLPNGYGAIRGNSATGWRIVLQPMQLKNGNSSGSRSYDVKVADWLKPMMDEYIEEYRDTLLRGKSSPYFFIGDIDGGIWEGMTKRVSKLTRKHIPGSPGFGPHAFRHLVATTWLRKNPGDFLTVAELLNDSLATVLANYAHLRRDDSFARYEAQMAQSR